MTSRSYLLVCLGALACTPEPVQNPDHVSEPRPLGTGTSSESASQPVTTEAAPAESASGEPSRSRPSEAPSPATSTPRAEGSTLPSSTQPNAGAAQPPNVPNAMPQPDAL